MKIGFDYRLGGIQNGGIGRYSFELLKSILEIDSENEYHIFHRASADHQELETFLRNPKVNLHLADIRHYSIAEQVILPKLLQKYDLDLVHFPNFNVPVFYKRPYVVTIHDLVHHRLGGHKKSTRLYFAGYKYVIQKAAQNARHIITISEQSKSDIVELLHVPEDKVSIIYEATNLVEVEEEKVAEVKKTYGLSRPYFLFVGVMERKKNLAQLMKGFELFLKKYNYDMDLVIAGKADPHHPEVRFNLLKSASRDHLVLTGFIDDSVLAALYQGAYAFTSASREEGFGLPGLEALRFGLPIVVADTPVFNEIYANAGIYFDPERAEDIADKLHLICRDTGFHEQQQIKGFERSQFFSWRKAAEQTIEVYRRAVA